MKTFGLIQNIHREFLDNNPNISIEEIANDTVVHDGKYYHGTCSLMEGPREDFQELVRQAGHLFTTNSPMMGQWEKIMPPEKADDDIATLSIPVSRFKDFDRQYKKIKNNGQRWGQALHDYLQLDKVTSHKKWCDQLYNANAATARKMIESVLDYQN